MNARQITSSIKKGTDYIMAEVIIGENENLWGRTLTVSENSYAGVSCSKIDAYRGNSG